jgi:integrase
MDTGLRPVEVRRARTDWLRLDKGVLHIPKDDSAKSNESWEPVLRDETVEVLPKWLDQRATLARYAGSDRLWLNNAGNPFQSGPLNELFDDLLEEADISRENRDLSWYSLRHTVGEHVREHGDIRHAKEQLRQKSEAALLQYDGPSVEKRQQTLRDITSRK